LVTQKLLQNCSTIYIFLINKQKLNKTKSISPSLPTLLLTLELTLQHSFPSIAFFQVDSLRSHLLPSLLPLFQLELIIKEKLLTPAPSYHKALSQKPTLLFSVFPLIAAIRVGPSLCFLAYCKMMEHLRMSFVLLLTAVLLSHCSTK